MGRGSRGCRPRDPNVRRGDGSFLTDLTGSHWGLAASFVAARASRTSPGHAGIRRKAGRVRDLLVAANTDTPQNRICCRCERCFD
jgi:hypothetical protein